VDASASEPPTIGRDLVVAIDTTGGEVHGDEHVVEAVSDAPEP
jgi:hypothetical protein